MEPSVNPVSQIDYFTEAFADFRKTAPTFDSENWSETDTRSKWIDTLFKGCLGWREENIHREVSEAGMRLDYEVKVLLPTLVIEAKRAAVAFSVLPQKKLYMVQLKKLIKANPTLKEHLEQVAGYCHVKSIPYAVLTNGRTLIIFVGKRDDRIPLWNGEAIVIADIFTDDIDFAEVYKLLGRDTVAAGSLARALSHARPDITSVSVLSSYLDPDALQPHTPLSDAVEPILERLFTDILDDEREEIIAACYVKPGTARTRNALESPLVDEPPQLNQKTINIDSRHSFDEFEKVVKRRFDLANSNLPTTLIIGNVGVGKSIFLRRFFSRTREDRILPDTVLPIFIDFRNAGSELERLGAFIDETLSAGVIDLSSPEQLKQIFRQEYRRWERTARGLLTVDADFKREEFSELNRLRLDAPRYLAASFEFIRQRYKLAPCVILDNADHHGQEFQRKVYLAAKELQSSLRCLLFVSVQESWYWHFKDKQGPLAAYHDVVFHVPAPRVRDVIAKRIDVAVSRFDSYIDRQMVINFGKNMVLEPKHISRFLENCKDTFFANDESATFFECAANGNVRQGLDLFKAFVRSGHSTSTTYLHKVVANDRSMLTVSDLLHALAKGDYIHYSGARSTIPNVFTILHDIVPSFNPRFAAVYLLQLLSTKVMDITPAVGRGFVGKPILTDLLARLGFPSDYHDASLDKLLDAQLIAPSLSSPEAKTTARFFKATALGNYTVKKLIESRDYLDLVAIDTPITDKKRFEELRKLRPEQREISGDSAAKAIDVLFEELSESERHEGDALKEYPFIQTWVPLSTRAQRKAQPAT
jgi:hypothetical protein